MSSTVPGESVQRRESWGSTEQGALTPSEAGVRGGADRETDEDCVFGRAAWTGSEAQLQADGAVSQSYEQKRGL